MTPSDEGKRRGTSAACDECGCPESAVIDSREAREHVRRRRKCANADCSNRWTTYEIRDTEFMKLRGPNEALKHLQRSLREMQTSIDIANEIREEIQYRG